MNEKSTKQKHPVNKKKQRANSFIAVKFLILWTMCLCVMLIEEESQ